MALNYLTNNHNARLDNKKSGIHDAAFFMQKKTCRDLQVFFNDN